MGAEFACVILPIKGIEDGFNGGFDSRANALCSLLTPKALIGPFWAFGDFDPGS